MQRLIGEVFENYRNRVKEEAKQLKEYLKGRVVKGTESFFYVPKTGEIGSRDFSFQYKKLRKKRNKIAAKARRINRMRAK